MAAPQTHGLISIFILFLFIFLASLGLVGEIGIWEFFSVLVWGVLIDFDHLIYPAYVRDLFRRVLEGGSPKKGLDNFVPWFHTWVGFLLSWIWGFGFHWFVNSDFLIFLPPLVWYIHFLVDIFQKTEEAPRYSFFYPFIKKRYYRNNGYPIKPAGEFIIGSFIWMIVAFVLLGILKYS
ncbi:MAG: hypothetical protein GF387_01720 [Candidatus Portnoybacteria bacterium]|nr:hypothetical protein [Candidatus Portnoybacteria bacterium]